MTLVSSKEFATKPAKYFNLAINEQVVIRRGKNMFHLVCTNGHHTNEYDEVLEPDEDLNNAITMDELLERTYGVIHKFFKTYKKDGETILLVRYIANNHTVAQHL